MKAKQSTLRAAERVVGEPVRDAVLVVSRKNWAWVVATVAFLAGLALASVLHWKYPWDFGLAGAFCGVAMQTGMTPRFLVRTEHGLALTSSKRWIGLPKRLLGAVDPKAVSIETGAINRRVFISGEPYVISRLYVARFRTLLEGLPDSNAPDVPPGYVPYRS